MPSNLSKLGSDSEDDRDMCRQLISRYYLISNDPDRYRRDRIAFLDLRRSQNAYAR